MEVSTGSAAVCNPNSPCPFVLCRVPNTILFKIITRINLVFKLFRSLQLQYSGPTGINFRYSYSFVVLTEYFFTVTVRYSYIKDGPWSYFSENYRYSYIKNGFRIKL